MFVLVTIIYTALALGDFNEKVEKISEAQDTGNSWTFDKSSLLNDVPGGGMETDGKSTFSKLLMNKTDGIAITKDKKIQKSDNALRAPPGGLIETGCVTKKTKTIQK